MVFHDWMMVAFDPFVFYWLHAFCKFLIVCCNHLLQYYCGFSYPSVFCEWVFMSDQRCQFMLFWCVMLSWLPLVENSTITQFCILISTKHVWWLFMWYLQVRGSSSTLLLFVMSCYVFVNTSSNSFDRVVNFAIHQAQCESWRWGQASRILESLQCIFLEGNCNVQLVKWICSPPWTFEAI